MIPPALVIAQTIDRPPHIVATFHGGYALDNAKRFAADHARVCGGEAWVVMLNADGTTRRLDGYTATERLAGRVGA